jgi:hypothetical protein
LRLLFPAIPLPIPALGSLRGAPQPVWSGSTTTPGSHRDRATGSHPSPSRLHLRTLVRALIVSGMFVVTEADADLIRAAFERGGEFSAAVELRRLFPGIADNAKAVRAHHRRLEAVGGAAASGQAPETIKGR